MNSKMQLTANWFTWNSFFGFSWLMKPPETCHRPFGGHEGLQLLSCKIDQVDLSLYTQAAALLDEIRTDAQCDFSFGALPPESFHVTYLDGINQGNVDYVDSDKKADLVRVLQSPERIFVRLPELSLPREIRFPAAVEMEFDELAIWGDGNVLVAKLRPRASDAEPFECIKEERRKLDRKMMDEWGKPLAQELAPHLSLGYFGYPAISKPVKKCLRDWNERAKKKITAPISFAGAEVYSFVDMTQFAKPSQLDEKLVCQMQHASRHTSLVQACNRAHLWDIPGSSTWSLTPAELRTIERLVAETPATTVKAKRSFIAWNGVITVAFEDFGPELVDLKSRLNASLPRLAPENPGALWPKKTLAVLNDGRSLTNVEATTLHQICREVDSRLENLGRLRVDELSVVAFRCRSLESRYITHPIALRALASSIHLSSEFHKEFEAHRPEVAKMLTALSPSEILRGIDPSGPRLSRYREPHSEFTLIADIADGSLRDWVKEFREQVDLRLPGFYTWFADSSTHMTIRGLLPK